MTTFAKIPEKFYFKSLKMDSTLYTMINTFDNNMFKWNKIKNSTGHFP